MTSKLGFAASAAVHSALAVAALAYFNPAPVQAPAEKRLTMSLAMFEKPVETPPPPEVKQVIPEPKPAPLPKPVAKPAEPEPTPVSEPVAEEGNPFAEEEQIQPLDAPQPPAEPQHVAHAPASEDHKLNYVSLVVSAVEKNKFYPTAARRRGLTGEVRITMNIMEDGSLSDLKVECEHPMLAKAAEDAVRKSCPLPRPGETMQCPMCLVFKMKFHLN